jgi:transcriptional regulator with XRE-family HTH domain
MVPVGEKIKALAKAKDLSIPQFAKALGYDRADNFYSIASGRSKPGWEIIEAIARTFTDVNLEWLLRDDSEMFVSPPLTQQPPALQQPPAPTVVSEPSIELLQVELKGKQTQLEEKEKRLADKDKIIELLEKALNR